jgi:ribonuclease HI
MDLTARLIASEVAHDVHADSDHLPIRLLLDISTPPPQAPKRRNWKAMDAQKLCEYVAANINLNRWSGCLETPHQIEDATDHLIEIVQQAIAYSTPWARPSEWANADWTPECTEIVKLTRRYRRTYTETHADDDWTAYTKARNRKGKVVSRTLQQGHRKRVQQTVDRGPRGMWRIAKWARSRGNQTGIIPTLHQGDRTAETAEQKADLLRGTFFPPPPTADLSDIEGYIYDQSQDVTFPDINEHKITKAIQKAPPDKAPGPDTIPNKVWRALTAVPAFIQALKMLFNACIYLGHNPQHFQISTTVVLRKAAPRDFRLPKSYHPIALLSTLGKVLESIIASRVSWALEEYGLLPKGHLGGRKGVSIDHAIQLILDEVHRAWGHGHKASMLLLDISRAFDNVSHQRLIHNIQTMRLGWIASWLQSFLSNRHTRLQLPGFLSKVFTTSTGIPQGSPLSPILFLIFNTPLIRTLIHKISSAGTTSFSWIDDSCVLATGSTYAGNVIVLETCLEKADRWARRHAAKFAPDKFELIHFTNPKEPEPEPAYAPSLTGPIDIWDPYTHEGHDLMPIQHQATIIQPTESARYLGIWLDKTLSFDAHRIKAINRANSSLEALRNITGSTWGASLTAMRAIYRGIVVPQLLYGAAAWFSPASRLIPATDQSKIINEFTKIQKRAAILISGAFRGTAAAALNMELHLLPIRLQMQQTIEETAIRIQTAPPFACPRGLTGKPRPTVETQRSGLTPLEALRKRGGPLAPTTPRRDETWESRKAYVLPPWEPPLQCKIEDYEAALKTHDEICKDNDQLVIYTDGSGYQGHVGASAVCLREQWTRRNHLGTEMDSTVYAAELDGIRMAIDTTRAGDIGPRSLTLFSDSQAAIQAIQNPRRPSGQYILRTIYEKVKTLKARGLTDVQIRWIPAHVGVAGNEAADEAAKEAAARGEVELSSAEPEQPIIRLAAAAKRAVRQRIQQRWKKQWEMEKGAKPTRRLIKAPHKKNLDLYKGLSKPHTSIIIQMRTMRVSLRHFLFKIGACETDRCSCGEGSQTPKHILLQCSLYAEARRKMINKLFNEGFRGNISDYDALVSDPQAIRYIAEFMHQTGLLSQFRHAELTEPAEQDQERGSLLRGSGIDVEDDG